jgi:ribokinase
MHIAVIGSCNVDLVVEAERRPAAGETVMGKRFMISPGGKGANQAVAAARLGADVYMIGCVADDSNGDFLINTLKKNHVNTDYVYKAAGVSTGTAVITLAEGDNSIIVVKGANDKLGQVEIDAAWDVISTADLVVLQYEIPMATNEYVLKRCHEAGVKVLLNPAPFLDTPDEWVKMAAYVTPNEHEAALMYPGLSRDEILSRYPGKILMTLGKEGVAYGTQAGPVVVPGFTVPVADTTGAGDTFNGAFAVAVSEGKPMDEAVKFANAAAALSVQKIGAQGGMPWRKDVEEMLESCRK